MAERSQGPVQGLVLTAAGLGLALLPLLLAQPAAALGPWLAAPPLMLAAGAWRRIPREAPLRDAVAGGLLWLGGGLLLAVLVGWPLLQLRAAPGLPAVMLAGASAGLALFAVWWTWPALGQACREGGGLAALRAAVHARAQADAPALVLAVLATTALLLALVQAWPGLLDAALRTPLLLAHAALLLAATHLAAWRMGRPVPEDLPAPVPRLEDLWVEAPQPVTHAPSAHMPDDGADAEAEAEAPFIAPDPVVLYRHVHAGRVEPAIALLEAGADPDALPAPGERDQRSLPVLAAVMADLRLLRALIVAGVDLNRFHAGLTPLLAATRDSWHGRPEAVMTLLANGADPRRADNEGQTPLHHAARSSDPGVAALLLDAGAVLDALDHHGASPLACACEAGNWRLAKFLLERGARPDPLGGQPVLHAAASGEDDPVGVQLLLRHKAKVDARDDAGRSALRVACAAGNAEIAAALLAAGADRNAADGEGITPLLASAAAASLPVLQVLAPSLPNPQAVDAEGRNALARLVRAGGEPEALRLLLQLGVDPAQADQAGRRPIDHAVQAGAWKLVVALDPAYPLPPSVAEEAGVELPQRSPEDLLREALDSGRFDTAGSLWALAPPEPEPAVRLLLDYAFAGDLRVMDWLLAHHVDAERPLPAGDIPIFRLIDLGPAGHGALARMLEHGLGAAGAGGLARYLEACQGMSGDEGLGDAERMACLLLERGADAFGGWGEVESPLPLAARLGWRRLCLDLLDRGVDPDARDPRGLCALHHACIAGDETLVRGLVRAGAFVAAPTPDGQTPLGLALAHGHATVPRWLEWRQWSLPGRPLLPADLPAAAMQGDQGAVERLIELGLSVDSPDAQGCTALLRASGGGHVALVDALLARGADVTRTARTGASPLSAAVSMRHVGIVERLLVAGARADQPLPGGITPLMVAAALGMPEMVGRLLAGRADANATDEQGHMPLHCAAIYAFQARDRQRALALLDSLLLAGADPDTPSQAGQTPLLLALGARAEPGSACEEDVVLAAVECLLTEGASLQAQDKRGFGALHLAALHGLTRVVQYLLRTGADPRARDTLNRTPHDIAVLRGFVDVAAEFEPARSGAGVSMARFLREPRE